MAIYFHLAGFLGVLRIDAYSLHLLAREANNMFIVQHIRAPLRTSGYCVQESALSWPRCRWHERVAQMLTPCLRKLSRTHCLWNLDCRKCSSTSRQNLKSACAA